VNLLDRITAMRWYSVVTLGATVLALVGVGVAIEEGAVPLIVSPIVPICMSVKLWRRGRSLRECGLRLRRVLLMPRARQVIPTVSRSATERALEKLAPREVLDGPHGGAIRRAVEDRAAILEIWKKLSKEERAHLPELEATVSALIERVASLAQLAQRVEQSMDPRLIDDLDARITATESDVATPEAERRLSLLRRQRSTFKEIIRRRATLAHQIDNVGLALSSLRLDLINLRSSGLQSALADVSTATQEARALSREISAALEAAEEVKRL
jgi:serine/threonine-protein kinase